MKKHYKKLLLVGILITLMLTTALPAMGAPDKVRVFVEFAPGAKGKVQQMLQKEGAQFHYTFDELNSFVVSLPAQALKGLEKNPNVVEIEEDAPRYPVKSQLTEAAAIGDWSNLHFAGNDTIPWGVQAVEATDVWATGPEYDVDTSAPTGAGITVCIIDTGYWQGHEDLPDASGGLSQMTGEDWFEDENSHGSHVGGTIVAEDNGKGVIGVAPGASVYIIKYFGNDGLATYASDLIAAGNECAANGADIISMSLSGTRYNRREERAFDSLYAAGILSIGAASNDGAPDYHYPASYDSVMSVAAVDSTEKVADFSQYNDQVEIAAPGVDVLSTTSYLETNSVVVNGVTYQANHIEFSARGEISGALVNGGLCGTSGSWAGKVVLCERGDFSFAEKVLNVQAGGGVAAIIYNNEPGNFYGTMDPDSSTIIGLSLSQEDGQYLAANQIDSNANLTSEIQLYVNGYEAWNGTSMATPHVSAVAALIWSANPTAINEEIREAIVATARDLGTAGRDIYYGYGLIQAAKAIAYLGGGPVNTPPAVTITSPADGTSVEEGTSLTFSGSALDAEDGNLSSSIAWTSSLDGSLGTGASVSAVLTVGTHTITASVADSGALPDSDEITVVVTSTTPNTPPTVTITAPASGTSVEEGTAISFAATATDTEDGNLAGSLSWTSSIDGAIGSGAGFSISTLSVGTHTITTSATDSGGLTDSDSITVIVTEGSTVNELFVDVVTNKSAYGDREWVTISVTVTDGSSLMAGATVTTTVTTANGGKKVATGLTGADGTFTSTFKTFIRKDGSGTYTVDAVATLSGYTDGVDSYTFTVN